MMRAVRVGRLSVLAVLCSSSLAMLPGTHAFADDASASARAKARRSAGAERWLELSTFVGYNTLGDSELGNSWAPEQVPGASSVFGARLSWLADPNFMRLGPIDLLLAFETEVSLAAASTGASDEESGRMSYFAPVIGWRAHARLRQPLWAEALDRRLGVHVLLGVGAITVASSSPYMARDTDPVGYAGVGMSFVLAGRWQLRVDGRQGVMPGRETSTTRVTELQLGLTAAFGGVARRPESELRPVVTPGASGVGAPTREATKDSDGDGLPDRLDRCPADPESSNGIDDADGCPEPDPDFDGVVGAADTCPYAAEDLDRFEDEDGCPEADNDRDGFADERDACPDQPETRNGIADADGCPDVIPEAVTRALAGASTIRFDRRRARVTPAAKKMLQPVLSVLQAQVGLGLSIIAMPDRPADKDLAKRRAEAVKWYLVDLGIAGDRLDTSVGPVVTTKNAPTIELKLREPKAPEEPKDP
jgi:outer membrane protein OmpA-like peptidoglycan-associated protein